MKPSLTLATILAFLVVHPSSFLLAQGPLTPPGAPAPTMKTLDQIEARTPLAGGTSTRTISASGSYYLTGNINISDGSDAIVIAASNVTLDLNGFALVSTSSPAAGTGVLISGERNNVAITNGNISGSVAYVGGGGDQFVGPGFADGIYGSNVEGGRVSHVSVSGVDQNAIFVLSSGYNSTVTDCTVAVAGDYGILASVVHNSSVRECGGSGISANSASNCHARTQGYSPSIGAVTASNCYGICGSTGSGVQAAVAINCYGYTSLGSIGLDAEVATGCTGRAGTGTALSASNATNCTGVSQSGTGLNAGVANNCYGRSDNGIGLSATYTAIGCFGQSFFGSAGLSVVGIASYCSGHRAGGTAITCVVAIGCSTFGGAITAPQGKFLGTP